MPLYKTITVSPATQLYIWKIEEAQTTLAKDVVLTDYCHTRLTKMKSPQHRRAFLSVRQLLKEAGYTDADVYYDENGKPHLKDHKYISITHSHHFSGIIISRYPAGIDLEKKRDKILRIASKFTPIEEYRTLANEAAVIRKLTLVWGAKEAVYKIMEIPGLRFREHIRIRDFDFEDGQMQAQVHYDEKSFKFALKFFEFEGFSCVYALPSSPH